MSIPTPEHDKLSAIKDQSQAAGEFLDWLTSERGIILAENHQHSPACYGNDNHLHCGYSTGDFAPVRCSLQSLLAGFYQIDLDKIEAEKAAILEEIRSK
jgi:hypothetical protein